MSNLEKCLTPSLSLHVPAGMFNVRDGFTAEFIREEPNSAAILDVCCCSRPVLPVAAADLRSDFLSFPFCSLRVPVVALFLSFQLG